MNVREFPFNPSDAERAAWAALVGASTPIPGIKSEMLATGREVYDRRIKQAGTDIFALGSLTEWAATLGIFGGPIDTQKTELFGPKPKSLDSGFRPVQGVRFQATGDKVAPAGDSTPE